MTHDRKSELIACCEGIIRNAEDITKDMKYNTGIKVIIRMFPDEAASVTYEKSFIPREVIDSWNKESEEE